MYVCMYVCMYVIHVPMYECMNECMHVFGVQSVDYELASYHMQRPCSCQGQSKQAIRPVGVSATAGHSLRPSVLF